MTWSTSPWTGSSPTLASRKPNDVNQAAVPPQVPGAGALDVDQLRQALSRRGYLADDGALMAVYLAGELDRPLLLEGAPGVGKTALATSLAAALGAKLIRLQCYEGLDRDQALYSWDYARQLLQIRTAQARGEASELRVDALFDEQFLVARPLLEALRAGSSALLLIDEIDRADDEFEAFLLEFLADFQITVPEIGTLSANGAPRVVLTSNRTRELSDALRRRCLYHFIDVPDTAMQLAIVATRAPQVSDELAAAVVDMVTQLRKLELYKPPGIAETIDWAQALAIIAGDRGQLDVGQWLATIGLAIKDRDDTTVAVAAVRERLGRQ